MCPVSPAVSGGVMCLRWCHVSPVSVCPRAAPSVWAPCHQLRRPPRQSWQSPGNPRLDLPLRPCWTTRQHCYFLLNNNKIWVNNWWYEILENINFIICEVFVLILNKTDEMNKLKYVNAIHKSLMGFLTLFWNAIILLQPSFGKPNIVLF